MSEFQYRKKQEYERQAERALSAGDFEQARQHIIAAARQTIALAQQSAGVIRQAYVANAKKLIALVERVKKLGEQRQAAARPAPAGAAAPGAPDSRKVPSDGEKGGEEKAADKWVVTEKPNISLAEVKGLEAAKTAVFDALINPSKYPDIYKTMKVTPGTGLLLFGPPGTGKTMFAKAIAHELDTAFMHVKLNDLKSKYVGETEANIAAMFAAARQHPRCVLFLDECESLLRKRGNQKVNAVEQFLVELDGFKPEGNGQLFVLLATNRPWLLDSAITRSGRISAAVYVNLPELETRQAIIEAAFRDVPMAPDVDLRRLAEMTEGYSGAELHHKQNGGGICDEARFAAVRRWIARRQAAGESTDHADEAPEPVCWADCAAAVAKVVPASKRDPDIIRRNLAFATTGSVEGDGGEESE